MLSGDVFGGAPLCGRPCLECRLLDADEWARRPIQSGLFYPTDWRTPEVFLGARSTAEQVDEFATRWVM